MRLLKTENRKIGVDELNISDAYQRTIVPARVSSIAKNLDQDALGSLTVGRRPDGSYWVVDGMQRLTALRKLGIAMVPCDVFESEGPEHEARVFRLKNRERTNVTSIALFRAQLTEGDQQTLAIASIVKRAGLKIALRDEKQGWPYVRAVKALERAYSRVGGDGLLKSLQILSDAWPAEDGAIQGDMIDGMCMFMAKNEGFDESRLVEKLKMKAVSGVVRAADAKYRLARDANDSGSQYSRSLATCEAIAFIYSKGLRKKRAAV